jgi:threonine aldolase
VAPIDLRSDTVTRPTPAMRQAMANAEVGDDAYGEDPTVNRLQETAAGLLGVEAALFVPSGTMANQASLRALTRPGDLVLASSDAHILKYEAGAPAALSGIHVHSLGRDGLFDGGDVRAASRCTWTARACGTPSSRRGSPPPPGRSPSTR